MISTYTQKLLVEMSGKVLEHIASNFEHMREGVKSVMGGKVLEYEAKTILNEGIKEGIKDGKKAAQQEFLIELLENIGPVPESLLTKVKEQKDLEVLKNWFKIAVQSKSLEEFAEKIY